MKKTAAVLVAVAFSAVCSVYADYSVWDKGTWSESWPKELEPLRKQSRTFEGPIDQLRYLIPFTKREDFESAWPHLLKVKSKGAPIILVRGPRTDFFEVKPAGVLIQSPPVQADKLANPETPFPGQMDVRTKWRNTTFIELVVDGEIVDLNRIQLPANTPIIDERFKDGQNKAVTKEDAKSIDGTWLPSSAELGGEKFPDEVRKTIKLVIGNGKYTVTVGKEPDRGTVKLDPSKKPKAMDINGTEGPNKGKTILAIYENTDDTLRICYDLSGKARPTEFKTKKGTQQFLVTYERKKP